MDDRKSRVLEALVEEYVRTGEPVSSKTVLEHTGLRVSSATIRNDLAKLEAYGFVEQPHTSAGRIPTPNGYRYYIDHCSPGRLRNATLARIGEFFSTVNLQVSKLLKETSHLLSDVAEFPAIVVGPGLVGDKIKAVHLLPLAATSVMTVVITEHGRVSQEVAKLPENVRPEEVARAEAVLSVALVGQAIAAAMTEVDEIEGSELPGTVTSLVDAAAAAVQRSSAVTREVYLGGTSRLAGLWQDLAVVHRLLALLEHDTEVMQMFGEPEEGMTVKLGEEASLADLDVAVVSTPYDAGEHGSGRIGVLGPMRMDYPRTIKVVEEVGDGLAESLGG